MDFLPRVLSDPFVFIVDMSNLKLLVDVYYEVTREFSVVLSGLAKEFILRDL